MLTEREKKLMLAASENMYRLITNIIETDELVEINVEEELNSWLENPVADIGGTVSEYLDWENKNV